MKNNKKNTPKGVKKDKSKKISKALIIAAIVLLVIWICLVVMYALLRGGQYLADWDAIREYDTEGNYVMKSLGDEDTICFVPDEIKFGLIFYQDELVENSAYIPLMRKLAASGVLCILPTMPLNLSNLDKDVADDLKEEYPEVKYWYIGGHGLGGEAAASHLSKNVDDYVGLILLGSYSKKNFSDESVSILSVYGDRDGVLNMKKYEKLKANTPETDFVELVIEGANHSGFGVYGLHDGDNEAEITGQKQIEITAGAIIDFMF